MINCIIYKQSFFFNTTYWFKNNELVLQNGNKTRFTRLFFCICNLIQFCIFLTSTNGQVDSAYYTGWHPETTRCLNKQYSINFGEEQIYLLKMNEDITFSKLFKHRAVPRCHLVSIIIICYRPKKTKLIGQGQTQA